MRVVSAQMDVPESAADDWIKRLVDHHRRAAGPNASPYTPAGAMIAVLSAFNPAAGVWTFLGPQHYRPNGEPLEIAIASYLGLRPFEQDFGPGILQQVTADEAKALLAYLALGGLGTTLGGTRHPQPSPTLLSVLDDGFAPFGSDVQCFSNGDYHLAAAGRPQKRGHMPLTGATVDTGVICHDGSVGFAFWVDWED